MAYSPNIFARYVWLIDLLRRYGAMSYEAISEHWANSGLGYGEQLPLRTFHNHRQAIADIFDIDIVCDIKGKNSRYYIDGGDRLSGDSFRGWLVDSLSVTNRLKVSHTLENRISVEHVPSGNRWLMPLMDSLQSNRIAEIQYRGYANPTSHTFEIKPYGLKAYKRRWYLIGYNDRYDELRTYSLDRIENVLVTNKTFEMNPDFDINKYYEEFPGIIHDNGQEIETIVIKVRGLARSYIADLPLHNSQKKVSEDVDSVTYQYRLRPTYDFIVSLLQQGAQVEVVSPQALREQMGKIASDINRMYNP